jgi:hypothetical protein
MPHNPNKGQRRETKQTQRMNKTTLRFIACYFNSVVLYHPPFTVGIFPNYVGVSVLLTQRGTSSTAMNITALLC